MANRRKQSDTQDMSNVYDITSKKPLNKAKKRKTPASNSNYTTGDTKRRNHALNRKKRRRIIRLSVFFFFVVALIFTVVLGISQAFFRVNNVTVEYTNKSSKHYYTNDSVVAMSAVTKGKNMLFVSSKNIGERLTKNMPYIANAVVKKDFPSTVKIILTECKKVYAYESSVGYCLADENGKFIEMADFEKAKPYTKVKTQNVIAEKTGEPIKLTDKKDTKKDNTEIIISYLNLVRKSGMKITSVDFTDLDDVYMEYDGRIKIHIGKMADEENGVTAWKKLQLAKKSLDAEDEQNPKQKGTLNMTIAKKAYFKAESQFPEK